jgi:hypothetical protein
MHSQPLLLSSIGRFPSELEFLSELEFPSELETGSHLP